VGYCYEYELTETGHELRAVLQALRLGRQVGGRRASCRVRALMRARRGHRGHLSALWRGGQHRQPAATRPGPGWTRQGPGL